MFVTIAVLQGNGYNYVMKLSDYTDNGSRIIPFNSPGGSILGPGARIAAPGTTRCVCSLCKIKRLTVE